MSAHLPRMFWVVVAVSIAGVVWTGVVIWDVHRARGELESRVGWLIQAQGLQRRAAGLPVAGDPVLAQRLSKLAAAVDTAEAGLLPPPSARELRQAARAASQGNTAILTDTLHAFIGGIRRQTGVLSQRLASRWTAMYAVAAVAFALAALAIFLWVAAWRRQQRASAASAQLQTALEELEVRREAAERESERKSAYLASMSHEMRTPLTGIIGLAEAVSRDADSDAVRERMSTIHGAGQGLLEIVNRLLDHAAIEAGKLELSVAPTSVAELHEACQAAVAGAAKGSGVHVDVEIAEAVPAWLQVDAGRLRQILVNFLGNAVKFSGGGRVLLRTSWDAGELHAAVLDEGPGLPAGDPERLFEPFLRGDASPTRRVGGTGLGLAICKSLAEAMGGRVWANDRPDGGAAFHLTLPAPPAEAPAAVVQVADVPMRGPAKVLVVDDNVINRTVVEALLSQDPVEVMAVASAREALALLDTPGAADLILMDCEMPEMDGWQATEAIRRRDDRAAGVPVVAMTAHSDAQTRDRCVAVGMDDFLGKPLTRDALIAIIGRWAGARSSSRRRSNLHGRGAHRTT